MAEHLEYIELISAAMDGALSPAEREKLDAHLAQCPECQALYEDMLSIHEGFATLPPAEVPAELQGNIMAAVRADNVIPFALKKTSSHWKRWAATAAVLALVMAGGWGLREGLFSGKGGNSSAAPAAAMPAAAQDAMPVSGEAAPAEAGDAGAGATEAALDAAGAAVKVAPVPELSAEKAAGANEKAETVPESATVTMSAASQALGAEEKGAEASAYIPDSGLSRSIALEGSSPVPFAPESVSFAPNFARSIPWDHVSPNEIPAQDVDAQSTTDPVAAESETVYGAALAPREALERLLEEYPFPGSENWEPDDLAPGWRSPTWTSGDGRTCWLQYEGSPYGDAHKFTSYISPADGEGGETALACFSVPTDGGAITQTGA